MKTEIKKLATDLLIRHGYRGFRFSDISDTLNMTRPNIHYHFGTKTKLIEEVIRDYVDETFVRIETIWNSDEYYTSKVLATMEFNRNRYLSANPKGNTKPSVESDLADALGARSADGLLKKNDCDISRTRSTR